MLSLRYGWIQNKTPQTFNCGGQFTVNHAMICHMGGFTTIRHNKDLWHRRLTCYWSLQQCCHWAPNPIAHSRCGSMTARSANTDDGASPCRCPCKRFWNVSQDAFFDVRVLYPNSSSNCSTNLSSVYRREEQVQKKEYGHGNREVRHGMFTPFALSTTGDMGREVTTFYKRVTGMIAQKRQHPLPCHDGMAKARP